MQNNPPKEKESTRDIARIGLLMLNRGKGNREQVIAENWIDEMIKQRTTSKETLKILPFIRIGVSILVMDICGGYGKIRMINDLKCLFSPRGNGSKHYNLSGN